MSISYSTIGWVSAVAEGKADAVSYAILGSSTGKIMGIFNGLGTMVFAYGGHSVVLEIQVSCHKDICTCCNSMSVGLLEL